MAVQDIFVFAVCGGKEHIETLNFSLKYLRHYSENEILVVTDLKRNEAEIEHKNVLNVETPATYDNHQASIYLKTGLHSFLPLQNRRYCYLDSDVIALTEGVDNIFLYLEGTIAFAPDHCRLPAFSPAATTCNCQVEFEERAGKLNKHLEEAWEVEDNPAAQLKEKQLQFRKFLKEWEKMELEIGSPNKHSQEALLLITEWEENQLRDEVLLEKKWRLVWLFKEMNRAKWKYPYYLLTQIFPHYKRKGKGVWADNKGNELLNEYSIPLHDFLWKKLKATFSEDRTLLYDKDWNVILKMMPDFNEWFKERGFLYEKMGDIWTDLEGRVIRRNIIEIVESKSDFKFDKEQKVLRMPSGGPVFINECTHLQEAIKKTFDIEITSQNWQHWNGGVFLFHEASKEFMDFWHKATLQIFEDPNWRTRDQGTLVATAWKFGLQDLEPLPRAFNLIADYQSSKMVFDPAKGFSFGDEAGFIYPHLAHIYHHWGDESWDVWQWVLAKGKEIGVVEA